MKLDKNGQTILRILLTDVDTLFSYHVDDYLAGKTGLSKSQVDYQLDLFVKSGFAHWEQESEGQQLKIDEAAGSKMLEIEDKDKRERIMFWQNWIWPIVVTAIGCLLTAWLSH